VANRVQESRGPGEPPAQAACCRRRWDRCVQRFIMSEHAEPAIEPRSGGKTTTRQRERGKGAEGSVSVPRWQAGEQKRGVRMRGRRTQRRLAQTRTSGKQEATRCPNHYERKRENEVNEPSAGREREKTLNQRSLVNAETLCAIAKPKNAGTVKEVNVVNGTERVGAVRVEEGTAVVDPIHQTRQPWGNV